jgi:hypothetical protein
VHDEAGEGEQSDPEERRALHLKLADHQKREPELSRNEQEAPQPDLPQAGGRSGYRSGAG